MKKYCYVCGQRIKRNDFVDLSQLDNPLLNGYWCRSCYLTVLYKMLDDVITSVGTLSAKLDLLMEKTSLDKHE